MKKILIIAIISGLFYACATHKSNVYQSINKQRAVIVKNDSILSYSNFSGCLGNADTLHYTKIGNTLIPLRKVKYYEGGYANLGAELSSSGIVIYKDSIIVKQTGEVLYSNQYKIPRKKLLLYIIINGKKKRITKHNIQKIDIDFDQYDAVKIDKEIAKEKYGINIKYLTLELIKKNTLKNTQITSPQKPDSLPN